MAKGDSVFSKEEMDAAFPPYKGFFNDGVTRDIVILDKKMEQKIGKTSGKEYTAVDWMVADAKTGEAKDIRFDFGFTNAMRDHKEVMRFETSVFAVTPVKTGERNGYPTFEYTVEYEGEDGAAPTGNSASQPF